MPAKRPTKKVAGVKQRWSHLRGDLWGGLALAVVTIPMSIGYGLFAFAPLGPAFASYGMVAGLYGAATVTFIGVLLGNRGPAVYAPRSIAAFVLSASIAHLIAAQHIDVELQGPHQILALVFLIVCLAGLFQAAFGLLRLGSLVKYMPHPVIAGFQNSATILLFLSQVPAVLALPEGSSVLEGLRQFGLSNALTLLVGGLTCAVVLRPPAFTRKIPDSITGLLAGTTLYFLLKGLGLGDSLGPLIGALPPFFQNGNYASDMWALATRPESSSLLVIVVSSALSLAIVSSLDSALCSKIIESLTKRRSDNNRELLQQGVGNVAVSLLGGLQSSISLSPSAINYRAGGRTRMSLLIGCAALLATMALLGPLIAYIPRAVFAGLLIATAFRVVDPWTISSLRRLATGQVAHWRPVAMDLLVVALVTLLAVFSNVMLAVAVGIVVAIASFMLRMSRGVVRRSYTCENLHSRKVRTPADMALLHTHGQDVRVFELEGAVFFGSAESLADRIEAESNQGRSFVILDLKRVTQVDSTGALILLKMHDRLLRDGKLLLVSHYRDNLHVASQLRDVGVTAAVTRANLFEDTDRAIEYAEDQLLLRHLVDAEALDEFPFQQLDILSGFDEEERLAFRRMLVLRRHARGEWIFREGDPGEELYLLARGRASVKISIPGEARDRRLVSFAAGTVFGEMALLDREVRSAGLQADEDVVCYVLTHDHFSELVRRDPVVAVKLLTNLGRELSHRLRRANRTIFQLET